MAKFLKFFDFFIIFVVICEKDSKDSLPKVANTLARSHTLIRESVQVQTLEQFLTKNIV